MIKTVLASLVLCSGGAAIAQAPLPAPLPSPDAAAAAQGASSRGRMDCLVEPSMVVQVGSPVDGVVAEVQVDRGDLVRKGQVVARLTSSVEAATVELARARVEFDQRRVERNETLFEKRLISEEERDEMVTEARQRALELQRDQEVLRLRTITSPLDGVVVERRLAPGELVRADQAVALKLAQLDPLNVEVIVPARMFGRIKVGMKGTVSLAPFLPGRYEADVVVVDRLIDAASSTFFVRLQLPNPDYKIPSGIRCDVRFGR